MGATYDSGDFDAVLSAAEQVSGFDGFPSRKSESEARGLLRGFGAAAYVERAAGGAEEGARIELDDPGGADVMVGSMTAGQGHATAHVQLVSQRLALDPSRIQVSSGRYRSGLPGCRDVRVAVAGGGRFGTAPGGRYAGRELTPVAAAVLECAEADIAFGKGAFTISGTDRSVAITELARLAHADRLPGDRV